jgi:uroporphyrinogen-III synthase
LHFSRRSAEAYVNAARSSGLLERALAGPIHYCLSGRIAEPLRDAGATKIQIAMRPDETALIELCR